MIELILSFTASIAIGYLLSRMSAFPVLRRLTDISTTIAIYLLLFFLGAQTGSNEDVLSNIASLGLDALLLALAGTVGSAFSAWLLYRYHMDFSLKAVESGTDNRKRSFDYRVADCTRTPSVIVTKLPVGRGYVPALQPAALYEPVRSCRLPLRCRPGHAPVLHWHFCRHSTRKRGDIPSL